MAILFAVQHLKPFQNDKVIMSARRGLNFVRFPSPSLSSPVTRQMSLPANPVPAPHRIVIQGVTLAGRAFRPSDWAERLCGIMSTFGSDRQMRYSSFVRPMMLDGVSCVVVEPALEEAEPRAYRFLLDFAADNELVVIDPTLPSDGDYCPLPGSALETLVT